MVETQDEAGIYWDIYKSRLLIIIPYTILVYDHLLTLSREVAGFWPSRRSSSRSGGWKAGTMLFFLIRYFALFGTIPIIVQYYSTTTDPAMRVVHVRIPDTPYDFRSLRSIRCRRFMLYHQYFALVSQVLVAVMLIMRTYALYARSRFILASVLLVTVTAFVLAVVRLLSGNDVDNLSPELAAFGCPVATGQAKAHRLAEAWAGMLVFDVVIFALTLYKALQLHSGQQGRASGLIEILLRDGSVYFALMVLSNGANIATYTIARPFLRGSGTSVTNVTSAILISRLMLNLRAPTGSVSYAPDSHSRAGLTDLDTHGPGYGDDGPDEDGAGGGRLTTVTPYYSQDGDVDCSSYGYGYDPEREEDDGRTTPGKGKQRLVV
ncbi:hypothetical protein MIND_00647400 [Mycena indigotica]|uniref:DUF6533 domain-containing protein n=1 Tax=Mycena indigotica TaxID=2126181 RepID=A0A8H6W617_9AGAR|nr:uncharacterized protein MIND_00647400 [Mycena indigotica]KAF7304156.1 hypothetical protein MIND_00647400 [Mycena indigotica]